MACSRSGCQSNCLNKEDGDNHEQQNGRMNEPIPSVTDNAQTITCSKCKENVVAEPQNKHWQQDRLCLDCFHSSIFGKFRLAVTAKSMICPSDKVLVGFSGGPASRVVLQFVHEMQQKAQMNFDASQDRSLPVFGVGVAFINENIVSVNASCGINEAIEQIENILSTLAPPAKDLHVLPLESIFSRDSVEGRKHLNDLLRTISDTTGKEDFLQHLRLRLLQKIASDNGYTKLVLGSCTSKIACHVISATVKLAAINHEKRVRQLFCLLLYTACAEGEIVDAIGTRTGQGYSLPADVQYVDARWDTPVVLPLRDCLAHELKSLCLLEGLQTVQPFDRPPSGINGLVSAFVARLQEENLSREHTIVRTAEKLTPFSFNKMPESINSNDLSILRRRKKLLNSKLEESISADILCAICASPLCATDLQMSSILGSDHTNGGLAEANCCQSCLFQIVPRDPLLVEHFYRLLPKPILRTKVAVVADQSWLREQIKDCLLLDDEAGS